jgi:hypothetical protein
VLAPVVIVCFDLRRTLSAYTGPDTGPVEDKTFIQPLTHTILLNIVKILIKLANFG